jgi:hypothetical protein
VRQGQRLSDFLRSGQQRCSDRSADDFELIGEYAMGRYLANLEAHAAMNRRMALMMGRAGEQRMRAALGHRYSGCSGGPASGWVGAMSSMMSGRSGGPGSGVGPGMMGGNEYEDRSRYRSTMMGSGLYGDSDIGVQGVVLIAIAAAALGGGLVALMQYRHRLRQSAAP